MFLEDGKGTGYKAKIDTTNRLHVASVSEGETLHAASAGEGYNINTGNITLTNTGTLLYIKNNEDSDLVVETLVFGFGTGTTSNSPEITIVRNPTGGDLISDASAVDMNQNRNFGSTRDLSVAAYKGKSGGTLTGGNNLGIIYSTAASRSSVPINIVIPKGQSMGISIDPKISSGSMKAYAAAIVYLKPESSAD